MRSLPGCDALAEGEALRLCYVLFRTLLVREFVEPNKVFSMRALFIRVRV